jgi:ATP-dependent DNA ligase
VKKPFPQIIEPMMASLIKDPFDSPDWIFETKMDGYLAIAVIDSTGKARIWSRHHLPLEPKFGYSITPMTFDPEPATVTLKPVAVNPGFAPKGGRW